MRLPKISFRKDQVKEAKEITEQAGIKFEITNQKENIKQVKSTKVMVNLFQTLGNTPMITRSFIVEKFMDPNDRLTYLKNEEEGFLELYPQKDDILKFEVPGKTIQEKEESIDKQINILKQKLKENKEKRTFTLNERDTEYSIRKLEAKRRMVQYSPEENYFTLGDKGMKTLFYHEKGSELIPINWDLDNKNTIHTDIAYKRRISAMATSNLLTKYQSKIKKAIDVGTVWLVGILIVWLIAMLIGSFFLFKQYQKFNDGYDESHLAELRREAEMGAIMCSKYLGESAKSLSEILNYEEKTKNIEQQIKNNPERGLDYR